MAAETRLLGELPISGLSRFNGAAALMAAETIFAQLLGLRGSEASMGPQL